MPEYVIESVKVAGAPFDSQAGSLQGFWIYFTNKESALWNKKVADGPPVPGPIWGELEEMTSKGGKKYKKFKKGQPEDAPTLPGITVADNPPLREALERIEGKLDQILFKLNGTAWKKSDDIVLEDIPDRSTDEMLDEVFGKPESDDTPDKLTPPF